MQKYKLLSHTADLIIHSESDSLAGLFASALDGLCKVMFHNDLPENVVSHVSEEFNIKSIDCSALIVDFLSDALSFMHSYNVIAIPDGINFPNDKNCIFKLSGIPVDGFDDDVKAVTYHGAEIIRNDNGNFEVNIILDI